MFIKIRQRVNKYILPTVRGYGNYGDIKRAKTILNMFQSSSGTLFVYIHFLMF